MRKRILKTLLRILKDFNEMIEDYGEEKAKKLRRNRRKEDETIS